MDPKDRIILALDVDNKKAAKEAVILLKDHVGAFKIGFELFVSEGPAVVKMVKEHGGRVFLDLKFHDIPNTVAKAARASVKLGVDFLDFHAMGGKIMMEEARVAVEEKALKLGINPPITLAVTVLTSLGAEDLKRDLNVSKDPEGQVVSLAKLAHGCGFRGVVASPMEVAAIRKAVGRDFIIVTPGVRPEWAGRQDQKRVATPAEAVRAGADYLVIGRPILGAKNPVEAAVKIRQELEEMELRREDMVD